MTFDYAAILQESIEKNVAAGPVTNVFNSNQIVMQGGKEVKIPLVKTSGLSNYDRANGYKKGEVGVEWKTYSLEYDRDGSFRIDMQDADETAFAVNANLVLGVKTRDIINPEIDCTRIQRIAQAVQEANKVELAAKPKADTIIDLLISGIAGVRDKTTDTENPIIFVDSFTKLEIQKAVNKSFHINLENDMFDGCKIVVVPSARMKTKFDIDDTGCKAAVDAKQIYVLIVASGVCHAITKVSKVKIVEPGTNQGADGYDVNFRLYHDLVVLDQYKDLITMISQQ